MSMRIKIRNSKDFYAGLIFIFFGALALVEARGYPMGTARRMGPGYFPVILGTLLCLLGVVINVRGLWWRGDKINFHSLRPLLLICAAVLIFALLIRPVGLVIAILILVFISCLGGWEFHIRDVAVLSLILAALAVGIFVYGLGLPFNLFWSK
jgi:hypothetical protein